VAADEQAGAVGARVALTESGEDRMRDRLWQPPTTKLSRGEVGKGRLGGKHEKPRSEPVSQSARFAILDIEAV
jgi:hypothetical protein